MSLVKPHGGKLVNRAIYGQEKEKVIGEIKEFVRVDTSKETAVYLEVIAHGVFSPLDGFMNRNEYLSVLDTMRLEDDTPWTIPIVLDLSAEEIRSKGVTEGDTILLTHNGISVAIMEVGDIYSFDKKEYAKKVFKTTDTKHPGVAKTFKMKDRLVGGKIGFIQGLPNIFEKYTLQPIETRVLFKEKGWKTVVGFQTRNVPHLGHEFMQKTALTFVDGLFINPVIGKKARGDFRDEVVLHAYDELIKHYYLKGRAVLAILLTEMRFAGPKEAILHAIVRKNFGCTHFMVGRDHAGFGDYYKPYEAQDIFTDFPDLGITPIFFKQFYYCKKCYGYVNERICPHRGDDIISPSGTLIRKMLKKGKIPPKEMMRPEVAKIILSFHKPFTE